MGYTKAVNKTKEELDMAIIHINNHNFEQEVLKSEKPVLLDFFATWCGPCKMLSPTLDQIAQERSDIKVCKVDVDQEPELAARYSVMSIPTLMVVKDGEIVSQALGALPKQTILQMLG